MNWRSKPAAACAVFVLALITVAPFFSSRQGKVPSTHDMAQHVSVLQQFDAALRSGSLYPRWQSEFNNGYGLPWLNYYPPGFYYFTEPFYLLLSDPLRAFFASCVVMMAASLFAFYAFARRFFSPGASAAGALFYAVTPYHTVDLYARGALPELTGFAFVPAVLLFTYSAGEGGRRRDIAALGAVHGAYLFSHFVVAYLLTLTLIVFAFAWSAMTRRLVVATRIGAGVLIAFAISASYWLVAWRERVYVREPFSALFPYHTGYVTLLPGDSFATVINNSFLAIAVAVLGSLFVTRHAQMTAPLRLLRYFAVATIFMVTPYSIYISRLIPNIEAVSFPWRWLVIASCFGAAIVAMAFDAVASSKPHAVLVGALIALNGVTSVGIAREAFRNPDLDAPLMRQEYGFVPGPVADPASLPDSQRVTASNGVVQIRKWLPLRRELLVITPTESVVRLKTLVFPGWRARIDGARVAISADSDGAQVIRVPRGSHRVDVQFGQTRPRNLARAISLAGLLIVAALVMSDRKIARRTPL